MRETEVRLDGWCEGGLRQQKNDGGGCATMRERPERVESLGTYVIKRVSCRHFCLALCSFEPRHIYQQVYLPELLERVSAGKRGRRRATYRSE